MNRKYSWLVPVAVAVILVTYFTIWPWYRDRPARAAADSLIAELDDHGGQAEQQAATLAAVPDNPTKADLDAQLSQVTTQLAEARDRTRELSKRAQEVLPQTPPGKRDELRQALERYTTQVGQALGKYQERGDQLRDRIGALKAAGKAGG